MKAIAGKQPKMRFCIAAYVLLADVTIRNQAMSEREKRD